jgi:hypothetical protein
MTPPDLAYPYQFTLRRLLIVVTLVAIVTYVSVYRRKTDKTRFDIEGVPHAGIFLGSKRIATTGQDFDLQRVIAEHGVPDGFIARRESSDGSVELLMNHKVLKFIADDGRILKIEFVSDVGSSAKQYEVITVRVRPTD